MVDCESSFRSLKELIDASKFAELPKPPKGFTLREVIRLGNFPTRLASDGTGKVLYVLCVNGDVWRVEPAARKQALVLCGEDYLEPNCVEKLLLGMSLDKQGRL